jgi:hypothetical protein
VQAFVGGRRHRREAFVRELERLGAKAADAIQQQLHATLPAQVTERAQVVEPPGCRLVMYRGEVCKARAAIARAVGDAFGDSGQIERPHPVACHPLVRNPVARADLRDPLPVNTVLGDQHAAVLRHESGHHALHRPGAGGRDQHGAPFHRIEPVHREQSLSRFVLEVEKLALAVAQVGREHAAAHTLAQRHRPWIEQAHQRAP